VSRTDFSRYLGSVDGGSQAGSALTQALSGETPHEAVAALACDKGFDVTSDDVAEALRRAEDAGPAEGELADDDLEGVAGGTADLPHDILVALKRGD